METTKELIPLPIKDYQKNGQNIKIIDARELHQLLQVKTKFPTWIDRRIKEGMFSQGQDYFPILGQDTNYIGMPLDKKDYHLTTDTAKHIALLERTEIGKKIRQALIDLEKNIKKPLSQLEIMKMSLAVLEEQEKRISQVENKVLAIEENQKQAEQHLLALPEPTVAPKTRTVRSLVTEVVRDYVVRHNMGKHGYSIAFSKLYREFKYRYSFDALARARNSRKSPLEIIEENGLIDDLYSLARELFGK